MELEALQEITTQITALGATLIALSPQRENFLRQLKKQHGLKFGLLRDAGNATATEFGLLYEVPTYLKDLYLAAGIDLARYNGEDSWTLPMPARYVIGRDSIIRARDVNVDYTVRPEPEQTLAELRNIKNSGNLLASASS